MGIRLVFLLLISTILVSCSNENDTLDPTFQILEVINNRYENGELKEVIRVIYKDNLITQTIVKDLTSQVNLCFNFEYNSQYLKSSIMAYDSIKSNVLVQWFFEYDELGRLLEQKFEDPQYVDSQVLLSYSHYDLDSIVSIREVYDNAMLVNSTTRIFKYNESGQLISSEGLHTTPELTTLEYEGNNVSKASSVRLDSYDFTYDDINLPTKEFLEIINAEGNNYYLSENSLWNVNYLFDKFLLSSVNEAGKIKTLEYTFDNNQNPTEIRSYMEGELIESVEYVYQ